jgi:putative flippase GtrA
VEAEMAEHVEARPAGWLRKGLFDHGLRISKFGIVGLSGLVVNSIALLVATSGLGVYYLVGAVLATQVSTVWNFVLTDRWVFADQQTDAGTWRRFWIFWAMNNAALLVRGPMIYVLTEYLGIFYAVSNVISLVVVMVIRYLFSYLLIWRAEEVPAAS